METEATHWEQIFENKTYIWQHNCVQNNFLKCFYNWIMEEKKTVEYKISTKILSMANKHMERCLTSLYNRELWIKITTQGLPWQSSG